MDANDFLCASSKSAIASSDKGVGSKQRSDDAARSSSISWSTTGRDSENSLRGPFRKAASTWIVKKSNGSRAAPDGPGEAPTHLHLLIRARTKSYEPDSFHEGLECDLYNADHDRLERELDTEKQNSRISGTNAQRDAEV